MIPEVLAQNSWRKKLDKHRFTWQMSVKAEEE